MTEGRFSHTRTRTHILYTTARNMNHVQPSAFLFSAEGTRADLKEQPKQRGQALHFCRLQLCCSPAAPAALFHLVFMYKLAVSVCEETGRISTPQHNSGTVRGQKTQPVGYAREDVQLSVSHQWEHWWRNVKKQK